LARPDCEIHAVDGFDPTELAPQQRPGANGKYFWRFSSSSNGAGIFLQWLLIQEPVFCRPIRANLVIIRYRLLHRLELSWLAPRPRHPQADAAAQAEFSQL